jgi:hypothetical protein
MSKPGKLRQTVVLRVTFARIMDTRGKVAIILSSGLASFVALAAGTSMVLAARGGTAAISDGAQQLIAAAISGMVGVLAAFIAVGRVPEPSLDEPPDAATRHPSLPNQPPGSCDTCELAWIHRSLGASWDEVQRLTGHDRDGLAEHLRSCH